MSRKRKSIGREENLATLAMYWRESFAETKRSLMALSDRDVEVMAQQVRFGERVG